MTSIRPFSSKKSIISQSLTIITATIICLTILRGRTTANILISHYSILWSILTLMQAIIWEIWPKATNHQSIDSSRITVLISQVVMNYCPKSIVWKNSYLKNRYSFSVLNPYLMSYQCNSISQSVKYASSKSNCQPTGNRIMSSRKR